MSTPDIGLANWFLQRALRTPERAALAFEGQTWSYACMQKRIEQLAGRLHGLGVRRGDRVAFIGVKPLFWHSAAIQKFKCRTMQPSNLSASR